MVAEWPVVSVDGMGEVGTRRIRGEPRVEKDRSHDHSKFCKLNHRELRCMSTGGCRVIGNWRQAVF